MPRVLQARTPSGEITLVVRDLLAMRRAGQCEAVTAIIHMVRDLKQNGRASRYALALKGLPLWELKTRSRGGEKGGARVYFFWRVDGVPVLCRAEVKEGDTPSAQLFTEAVRVYREYVAGGEVL